jgi:hypothetical protein
MKINRYRVLLTRSRHDGYPPVSATPRHARRVRAIAGDGAGKMQGRRPLSRVNENGGCR